MAENYTILVDLERCVGCWTCGMACKMAHHLGTDDYRLSVRTQGSGGIDEPFGNFPNLRMSWMPVYSNACTLCADRLAEGERPYCEMCCPAQELYHGDMDDPQSAVAQKHDELLKRGYREFRLGAWENSRKEVLYMSAGK